MTIHDDKLPSVERGNTIPAGYDPANLADICDYDTLLTNLRQIQAAQLGFFDAGKLKGLAIRQYIKFKEDQLDQALDLYKKQLLMAKEVRGQQMALEVAGIIAQLEVEHTSLMSSLGIDAFEGKAALIRDLGRRASTQLKELEEDEMIDEIRDEVIVEVKSAFHSTLRKVCDGLEGQIMRLEEKDAARRR